MFFAEFSFSSKVSFLPFCSEKNIPIILFAYTPFSCCVFSFFVCILFLFVDTVLSFLSVVDCKAGHSRQLSRQYDHVLRPTKWLLVALLLWQLHFDTEGKRFFCMSHAVALSSTRNNCCAPSSAS